MNNSHKLALAALAAASLALGGCVTTPAQSASSDMGFLENMLSGRSSMQGDKLERAVAAAAENPLGSERNPVRASMPQGQRAYLSRLRCASGWKPDFERRGSAGISPYDNIVDVYQVTCRDSTPATSAIYMDMYHAGHVEGEAVPGFDIEEG